MLGKIRTTQTIDALTIEWRAGTHAPIPKDESFNCKCDICALGGQPVHHSRIGSKFQAFTTTPVGSSPRHLGDDFRYPSTRPLQHFLDIRPAQIDTSVSANPSATDRLAAGLTAREVFGQIFVAPCQDRESTCENVKCQYMLIDRPHRQVGG